MHDHQDYTRLHTLPPDYCGALTPPMPYPLDGSLHHPNPRAQAAARNALQAILAAFAAPAPTPTLPIPCPRCLREVRALRQVERAWLGCGCGWLLALTPAQVDTLRQAVQGRGELRPAALVATWTLHALCGRHR